MLRWTERFATRATGGIWIPPRRLFWRMGEKIMLRPRSVVLAIAAFLAVWATGIALSLLAAIYGTQPGQAPADVVRHEFAVRGAVFDWPTAPPSPWPPPDQLLKLQGRFGDYFNVLRTDESPSQPATHQMEVNRYGWPWRVLEEADRIWPWDDPAYQVDAHPETGMRVLWANLLVPPGIAGFAVAAMIISSTSLIAIWRRKQGRCARCGYRLDASMRRCSECGFLDPRRAINQTAQKPMA